MLDAQQTNMKNKSYICACKSCTGNMPRNILIYIFLTPLAMAMALSCSDKRGIIPEDTMSRIYYDMYMTDEALSINYSFRRMADTTNIYEPIFKKYGYTSEDYRRSVSYYLEKPDRFEDVFVKTKEMLEIRKKEIENILEAEGKRPRLWPLIDSLELYTAEGIHAGRVYKNLRMMFFKPDSLVPDSPVIDSAFMERPVNTFLVFNDSALNADRTFTFYRAKSFMDEIKDYQAIQDSIARSKTDTASVMAMDADSRKIMIRDLKLKHKFSEPTFMPISPKGRPRSDKSIKQNGK